jgi:hypothetical protein
MVALLTIGAVSGFGSAISGACGPLFSVPIMLISGFAPLMLDRLPQGDSLST